MMPTHHPDLAQTAQLPLPAPSVPLSTRPAPISPFPTKEADRPPARQGVWRESSARASASTLSNVSRKSAKLASPRLAADRSLREVRPIAADASELKALAQLADAVVLQIHGRASSNWSYHRFLRPTLERRQIALQLADAADVALRLNLTHQHGRRNSVWAGHRDTPLEIGLEGVELAGSRRPRLIAWQVLLAAQVLADGVARDSQLPRDRLDAMALTGQRLLIHLTMLGANPKKPSLVHSSVAS